MLLGVVITVAGWFVVYSLSLRRDQLAKRRDLSISYLIQAWQRLERAGGARRDAASPSDRPVIDELERALADIQLFGNAKQVDLVLRFAATLRDQHTAALDDLLHDLRTELRRQLGLRALASRYQQIRINA